jgi:hypothetical protein
MSEVYTEHTEPNAYTEHTEPNASVGHTEPNAFVPTIQKILAEEKCEENGEEKSATQAVTMGGSGIQAKPSPVKQAKPDTKYDQVEYKGSKYKVNRKNPKPPNSYLKISVRHAENTSALDLFIKDSAHKVKILMMGIAQLDPILNVETGPVRKKMGKIKQHIRSIKSVISDYACCGFKTANRTAVLNVCKSFIRHEKITEKYCQIHSQLNPEPVKCIPYWPNRPTIDLPTNTETKSGNTVSTSHTTEQNVERMGIVTHNPVKMYPIITTQPETFLQYLARLLFRRGIPMLVIMFIMLTLSKKLRLFDLIK